MPRRTTHLLRLLALFALPAIGVSAGQAQPGATVQLPLADYQALHPTEGASSSAGGHAASDVRVSVVVEHSDGGAPRAVVTTRATLRRFGEDPVLAVLPAAGPVTRATEGGRSVERVNRSSQSLVVLRDDAAHALEWVYTTHARRHDSTWILSLPNPGPGGALEVRFDRELTPHVLPANDVRVHAGSPTRLEAALPNASALQVTWSAAGDESGFALSEARYEGQVLGDSLRVDGVLRVELEGATARIPVLPAGVALRSLTVDRRAAAIATEDGFFVVPVRGRGRHTIELSFVAPVTREGGLPHVDLRVAETPVSAFAVTLDGEREVRVTPTAAVTTTRRAGGTLASFHVPMTSALSIAWSEAVPEASQDVALRASAEIVHAVLPGEGVLDLRAFVDFAVSRGAMTQALLAVPEGAQINAVSTRGDEGPELSDWRVTEERGQRTLRVFFDREVSDAVHLDVRYERAWPTATRTTDAFEVPLLRALPGPASSDEGEGVHRQRGMVALASVEDRTLEPRTQEHLTAVGANLLPSEVRDAIGATVAHTFRYQDEPPRLVAIGADREPEPARFDAQVDALVSLGDVSTAVVARVELDVKSGSLEEVQIHLPASLNVLEVSAPSLRRSTRDGETLRVELTQPMQGRFTIELLCDQVTAADAATDPGERQRVEVPMVRALGAEVERGRVGVEALAPFQVDVAHAEQLTAIDAGELPEPLVLRTDNPILHAFRYARTAEPPRFALAITRHAEVRIANANVDDASYETLVTADGVAVTTAHFTVRNRRQQFLRLRLPAGSEVWSAEVGGRAQTPALESDEGGAPVVLLNIVSADEAFPVEVVYATDVARLGGFGRVALALPALDLVAAETTWSVVMPSDVRFATPDTDLLMVEEATPTVYDSAGARGQVEGVRYVFRRMFAARADAPAQVSFAYVSGIAGPIAHAASGLGALLLWFGVLGLAMLVTGRVPASLRFHVDGYRTRDERDVALGAPLLGVARPYWIAGALLLGGAALLAVTLGWLAISSGTALGVSAFVMLGLVGLGAKRHLPAWRARLAGLAPAPTAPVAAAAGPAPLVALALEPDAEAADPQGEPAE